LAEPELLTYVLPIECDTTAERATQAAYILTLILSCDYQSAPQHGKNWHLGLIGREAVRVAATLMTVAYSPADHAYKVAASAEGPASRGGRSRPIDRQALFHRIPIREKELSVGGSFLSG
jgi:hypothetical protein